MTQRNKHCFFATMLLLALFGCESALEKPLEKSTVTLLSPSDSLSTQEAVQIFYWEKTEGAIEYQLQVVSPSFSPLEKLIEDTIVNTNRFTIELPGGFYEWRVRGLNNSSASPFSNTFHLEIQ